MNTITLRRDIRSQLVDLYHHREADQVAALIIEHVFNVRPTAQLLGGALDYTPEAQAEIQTIVHRLSQQEPVQYILGRTEFYGHQFKIDSRGLIPRPETEELVNWVIQSGLDRNTCVLDIGSGSGCIGITLALETGCRVIAVDNQPSALALTIENANLHQVEIETRQVDILLELPNIDPVDIIISNPPYVPESDKINMEPRVKYHEPGPALFVPDNNVLLFYQRIVDIAPSLLKPAGQVFLEVYHLLGKEIKNLFKEYPWSQAELKKDINGKDRMVRAILAD